VSSAGDLGDGPRRLLPAACYWPLAADLLGTCNVAAEDRPARAVQAMQQDVRTDGGQRFKPACRTMSARPGLLSMVAAVRVLVAQSASARRRTGDRRVQA
jgi:hypothetical protein